MAKWIYKVYTKKLDRVEAKEVKSEDVTLRSFEYVPDYADFCFAVAEATGHDRYYVEKYTSWYGGKGAYMETYAYDDGRVGIEIFSPDNDSLRSTSDIRDYIRLGIAKDTIYGVVDADNYLNEDGTPYWIDGYVNGEFTSSVSSIMKVRFLGDKLLKKNQKIRVSRIDPVRVYTRGSYVSDVIAEEGVYPTNGERGDRWYVRDRLANQAPVISGSNLNLGSQTEDFVIDYTVSDADGDTVTVAIYEDTVKKVSGKSVALNTKYTYPIDLTLFTLGTHRIRIVASDGQASAERVYTFTKSNTTPVISGEDRNLGARSTAFTETYRVSDANNDDVSVVVTLDDIEIATISSAQDKELSYTITDEQLLSFEIGSTHTVTIKADDGKGGVAYRRHTFTKVNRPPIISGKDEDLGQKDKPFTLSYSFTDVEKDAISYAIYVDGVKKAESDEVEDGKEYSYEIPHDEFIQLPYGKHTITFEAWDAFSADNKQTRTYTFERVSGGLEVEIKINEFDVQPKKIIGVPHGIFADDCQMGVFACNNYLDAKPAWEDMSAESKAARAFAFTNSTKTADKWSIGIKVVVENGASGLSSVLRGLKGGYE